MRLGFVGAGYVGLVSAAGFAKNGHECHCIDLDEKKVEMINSGVPPIFENGLEPLLKKLVAEKMLRAHHDPGMLSGMDAIFICVGTPSLKDGSIDLKYMQEASLTLGRQLKGMAGYPIVIVKSTVIPGTTFGTVRKILEKESGKQAGRGFGLAMIPEFLKEGSALEDFERPDRIIIGCEDSRTAQALKKLHSGFGCEVLIVPISTAEMIKYASNSFLATKISFINQLANLCEKAQVDVDLVARGMGLDRRIGPQFLKAGPGFGGSCFPKDVKALMHFAQSKGVEPTLLEAVMEVNYLQPLRMIELAGSAGELAKKKVAVLGLSFKPNTDDIRESPAIMLIQELLRMKCAIAAYDPKGMANFRKLFPHLGYAKSMDEALKGAEACFIVTDWEEFKKPLGYYEDRMKRPLIIDSRRILDPSKAGPGSTYRAIGREHK